MLRMERSNRTASGAALGGRLALSLMLLAGSLSVQAAVCRVTFLGSDGSDGSSWADAMDLPTALADDDCGEIWVKSEAGKSYKPGVERNTSFRVERELELYGGFAGTETRRDERDPDASPTVLSGNIGNPNDSADNSYHVLRVDGTTRNDPITNNTVIDGFTIEGGNADGALPSAGYGGGLYCDGGGATHECSPTLRNITFSGNSASDFGGAVYNDGSSGGASSPVLINVTFSGNNADNKGGAMYNNGKAGRSSPALINVTFSNNSSGEGGGMYNQGEDNGSSKPELTNVIVWGNTAAIAGSEIFNSAATPRISHSVIQGSGGSSSWDSGLGDDLGGNLDADPMLGPLQDNGGSTHTMLPDADGSAIDAGDDNACPTTDQRGVARPQGTACDIGAVELVAGQSGGIVFEDRFEQ